MRVLLTRVVCILIVTSGGIVTWSLLFGQDPAPSVPAPPTAKERGDVVPTPGTAATARGPRDLTKLSPLGQHMLLSSQRGAAWLVRANRADGRFDYGYLPALRTKMEGDHYLRQAGAVFALARMARLTGEERHAAVARQALLTLLLDTTLDKSDKNPARHTSLPSIVVNRLGAAGLLVLAIHELPSPAEDLLEQSDQLCNYIRRQQQADGSLAYTDNPAATKSSADDPEGVNYYPGEALYGLMLSQRQRPAAWKTDLVRKALAYYLPWWRKNKNMALVPWQTAAYAEAYLLTREKAFADAVCEMNDWLCDLQYTQLDPRRPLWVGGFMGFADGRAVAMAPQVGCASYAESLAEACRVTRQAGDPTRHHRYKEALERCLQFLMTLQYTDANTQHFADWYRPWLLGGFYASHQDGNLRIDFTQHAVCAFAHYLMYVME